MNGRHPCGHWCAAHWWYWRGQFIPYPILVPGPQMFVNAFIVAPSTDPPPVVVHCGPEAIYPLREEWEVHRGKAL